MSQIGQTLLGQTAVITGAAAGIGQGYEVALAALGADIACGDVQSGEKTRALVEQHGRRFYEDKLDVSSEDSVSAFAGIALVDERDTGGPAVAADFEHLTRMMPAALTRRDGAYIWREGDDAKTAFRAVDGTRMEASGFSSIDVVGLATATDAPNVQFNIATGVSSARRRGEPMSTEIVNAGEDHACRPLRTRHAVVHPEGAAPLTGIGVAMLLERLNQASRRPRSWSGTDDPRESTYHRTGL